MKCKCQSCNLSNQLWFSACKQSNVLINGEGSGVLVNDEICHDASSNTFPLHYLSNDIMDGKDKQTDDNEDR